MSKVHNISPTSSVRKTELKDLFWMRGLCEETLE